MHTHTHRGKVSTCVELITIERMKKDLRNKTKVDE